MPQAGFLLAFSRKADLRITSDDSSSNGNKIKIKKELNKMKSNKNESKTAAIFARTSTNETPLETQITECQKLAPELGYTVTNVYKMVGSVKINHSVASELDKLLGDAEVHKFDSVIITSMDRFSRDARVALSVIVGLKVSSNIDVISTDGKLDTRQADWKSIVSVMAVIAEHEHTYLSERAKKSWARRKAKAQGAN
jgi:DNA invertase Pin-like site-specific DNA recombinase